MARSSSTSPSNPSAASTKKQFPVQPSTVRLHIAPLTPDTTTSLIPASVLDEAARQTLSYHTVQTSPENSYAFLDLPKDQAEKLKKRLNGTVFRGTKVRVDEARPETWVKHPEPEEPKMDNAEMLKKDKKEKRKRSKPDGELKVKKRKKGEDGTLEGVELPEGRKVQRGWTKPSAPAATSTKYAGKSAPSPAKKSEDDSKRECLFKTPLPPNKTTPKDGKKEEKKDKKKRKREVVVKEFKNNTKFPQFLKVSQLDKDKAVDTVASEYVEGVGWVNAKGELVEEEKIKKRAATIVQIGVGAPGSADASKRVDAGSSGSDKDEAMADVATTTAGVVTDMGSEDDSSSGSDSESENPDIKSKAPATTTKSNSSSESSSDSEASSPKTSPITPITPIIPVKRTLSSSSANSPKSITPTLQITIPTISTSPVQIVHPLEALYKPTAKNTTLLQAGVTASPSSAATEGGAFRFGFGADYDSEAEEAEPIVQTPYRERYRSAAPTPDTAIGHRKFFPDDGDDTSSYGRLGFVPSTPRVVGGFPGGQDLFSRKDATPYTPTTESPLLFPHSESRFLGALSVWSKLPTPKTLSQTEEAPVEVEEQPKKDKKGKGKGKGKAVAESIAEEDIEEEEGEKTAADTWSEKFYENRGEWNRAWKGRRRDMMKQKRKREAAGGPAAAKRVAT